MFSDNFELYIIEHWIILPRMNTKKKDVTRGRILCVRTAHCAMKSSCWSDAVDCMDPCLINLLFLDQTLGAFQNLNQIAFQDHQCPLVDTLLCNFCREFPTNWLHWAQKCSAVLNQDSWCSLNRIWQETTNSPIICCTCTAISATLRWL